MKDKEIITSNKEKDIENFLKIIVIGAIIIGYIIVYFMHKSNINENLSLELLIKNWRKWLFIFFIRLFQALLIFSFIYIILKNGKK